MPRGSVYGRKNGAESSRRAASPEVEDDEDQEDETQETPERTQGGSVAGVKPDEIRKKALQLSRMALFWEYRRQPIKRAELAKQLGLENPRAFPVIYGEAQVILRSKFGMELVEMRARPKAGQQPGEAAAETQATQRRDKGKGRQRNGDDDEESDEADGEATQQAGKRQKVKGSGMYILRSVLPEAVIASMSTPKALPVLNSAGEQLVDPTADGDDAEDSGALLRWEKGDGTASGHVALLGIRTVILCLVLANERVIQDDHLRSLLKRLDLYAETLLPYTSPDAKEPPLTLDKYLDVLDKQNYLTKVKLPNMGPNDGPAIEWRWGGRELEFNEEMAAKFIEDIMIDAGQVEEEEEQESGRRANGRRTNGEEGNSAQRIEAIKRKLRSDIEKAAGSALRDD